MGSVLRRYFVKTEQINRMLLLYWCTIISGMNHTLPLKLRCESKKRFYVIDVYARGYISMHPAVFLGHRTILLENIVQNNRFIGFFISRTIPRFPLMIFHYHLLIRSIIYLAMRVRNDKRTYVMNDNSTWSKHRARNEGKSLSVSVIFAGCH